MKLSPQAKRKALTVIVVSIVKSTIESIFDTERLYNFIKLV